MYTGLGQETLKKDDTKELLVGIAAMVDPIAQATSSAFEAQMRGEVDAARIKAGLPPLLPDLSAPPQESTTGISSSSLLLGLMVVGSVLYFLSLKKKD